MSRKLILVALAFIVTSIPADSASAQAAPSPEVTAPETASFTVKEYRIYRAVVSAPMSVPETQAFKDAANRYGVPVAEARSAVNKVQEILFRNGWFGSPASEIRHASDWKGEKP